MNADDFERWNAQHTIADARVMADAIKRRETVDPDVCADLIRNLCFIAERAL